jgi:hypothetical protein
MVGNGGLWDITRVTQVDHTPIQFFSTDHERRTMNRSKCQIDDVVDTKSCLRGNDRPTIVFAFA